MGSIHALQNEARRQQNELETTWKIDNIQHVQVDLKIIKAYSAAVENPPEAGIRLHEDNEDNPIKKKIQKCTKKRKGKSTKEAENGEITAIIDTGTDGCLIKNKVAETYTIVPREENKRSEKENTLLH